VKRISREDADKIKMEQIEKAREMERRAQMICAQGYNDPRQFDECLCVAGSLMRTAAELNPDLLKRGQLWWVENNSV